MAELIIGDHNWQQHALAPTGQAMGLVPRNFATSPVGSVQYTPVFSLPVIPQSEWKDRIKEQLRTGRRNSDFRRTGWNGNLIPALDQNGKGYCWTHSTIQAIQIQRAVRGLPYLGLSAYAVACIIKGYRDEGGWCGESLKFLVERGVPSEIYWPQRSMDRANDKTATWEDAAKNKVSEGWYDLSSPIWGQKLSFDQDITCRLLNLLIAEDYNWWGHSVCGMDVVDGETQRGVTRAESGKLLDLPTFDLTWGMNNPVTAGFGKRDINSWGDTYGDLGEFILTGSKAQSDGAVAIGTSGA